MVFGNSYMSLNGGFVRLNLSFPPILAVCGFSLKWFMTSSFSTSALTYFADKGVPLASVPAFVAAFMPMFAFVINLPVIMGLAASEDGYENMMPRNDHRPDRLKDFPTLFRFKSAHNNTMEACAMLAPVFFAAQTLKLDQIVFAKLSVFFLLCRVLYFFAYVLNSDALRTTIWVSGFLALNAIAFGALFRADVHPLAGVASFIKAK